MTETDQFIVNSIKEGNFKAFEILFRSYYSTLCKYSCSLINDAGMAEDIVSDLMAKIWESPEKIDIHTSLKSYLLKSVHNSSLNYLTRQRHRFRELNHETLERINAILCQDESPSEQMISTELTETVQKATDSLPDECRRIFLMSRKDGLSHKEIAEKLEISPNTVKVQIYRALSKIRETIKEYL